MRVLPRLFVDCIKLGPARHRSRSGEAGGMSCHGLARQRRINPQDSIGVTDNDCFAFLSHQPGIDEMDFLPKTALSRNG
jgi:hypothetical protein